MRLAMRGVVVLALLTATGPAAAGAVQWLPRESWPGGKQADARLDRPVTLWVTAAPLREVLAQLEAQTGVHFGFDPPGDDNARLCVNVYLNPQSPPSLREVMAQLSWVMDCGFAVSGEGEAREYLLLSAGPPQDFEKLWWAEEVALGRQEGESAAQRDRQLRQAAVSRLLELRTALALPREEAIRRYRGSDDALLLVLLDPEKRARAQIVTLFSEEQIQRLVDQGWLASDASSWTPEQRAMAEAASGLPSVSSGQYYTRWVKRGRIGLRAWNGGAVDLDWDVATEWPPGQEVLSDSDGPGPPPLLPLAHRAWTTSESLDLRRLLGEAVTPEIERQIEQEYEARGQAQVRASRRDDVTTALARAPEDLSPTMRARLEQLVLPLSLTQPHALWEVQQAAASASGLNVVSDHFWQPPRDLAEFAEWLAPEGCPGPTALPLIEMVCAPYVRGQKTWEWGEAGSFLRFRDRGRARWRAALLPPRLLEAIDADLAQLIPPPGESPKTVRFTIDLRPYQALVVGVSPMQLGEGKVIADGRPPADPLRAAREEVLSSLGGLAFFASFDERQWAKLQAEGLEAAGDLSLDQLDYLRRHLWDWKGNLREVTVRLIPMPENDERAMEGDEPRPPLRAVRHHVFNFQCLLAGKPFGDSAVLRSIEITLDVPAARQGAPGGG